MKLSPRQMLIRKYVKSKMVWFGELCGICSHKIMFESMFKIKNKYYCMDCCPTKENAFNSAFPEKTTAQDIIVQREREKIYNLIKDIENLPDGEVSPSVYNVLLKYSPDIYK